MARAPGLCLAILLLAACCNAGAAPVPAPPATGDCKAAAIAQAREMLLADRQGGPQLLFLGDSITEAWRGTTCGAPCKAPLLKCGSNPGVMKRYFGQYRPAVQAIAGQHVGELMGRMLKGALPTRHQPKVVVLLIGTNDLSNLGFKAPGNATLERKLIGAAPIVAGRIQDAVSLLRQRLPASEVVLLGVLPRGIPGKPMQTSDHRWPSPYARALRLVNTQLRAFAAAQSKVRYVGCGGRFLNANRTAIDAALMPDALHPSAAGMERGLAQCIQPLVRQLMRG